MNALTSEQVDAMVIRIVSLIDDMTEVIRSENAMLAEGVPASLSELVGRKASLAAELEQWTLAVRQRRLRLETADPELCAWMRRRGADLQEAMEENLTRLEAAILGTRRRIEAVMRAVREQVPDRRAYQANGRMAAASGPAAAGMIGRMA